MINRKFGKSSNDIKIKLFTVYPRIQPVSQIKPSLELNPGQPSHPN